MSMYWCANMCTTVGGASENTCAIFLHLPLVPRLWLIGSLSLTVSLCFSRWVCLAEISALVG